MSIDYPTLIAGKSTEGSIKNWINNSLIPSTIMLTMAEEYIYRQLRTWRMVEKTSSTVMTIGQRTVNQPAGYLWPRLFMITGVDKGQIKHKLAEDIELSTSYDSDGALVNGKPQGFYARGTVLEFDRPADKAYPYELLFYKQPDALDGSNKTNFLTDRHPRLIYNACLWAGYEWHRNHKETLYYKERTDEEIFIANQESDAEEGRNLELDVVVDGGTGSGHAPLI